MKLLAALLLFTSFPILQPQAEAAPRPTLAVEDTLFTEVPEVLVHAPRVTLDEILERVARGEELRENRMTDQQFTVVARLVRDVKSTRPAALLRESVWRVYKKRPDRFRTVMLRDWMDPRIRGGEMEAEFTPTMGERLVNFAFRPEARADYRYRLVGRDLVGGRVIYRIAFEPRSLLGSDPSGEVWVETSDFVIVREELAFRGSPVPLLMKGVDRMVIERVRHEGHWVLSRVLIRVEFSIPVPRLGKSLDFSLAFRDYAINRGVDDAIFQTGTR